MQITFAPSTVAPAWMATFDIRLDSLNINYLTVKLFKLNLPISYNVSSVLRSETISLTPLSCIEKNVLTNGVPPSSVCNLSRSHLSAQRLCSFFLMIIIG